MSKPLAKRLAEYAIAIRFDDLPDVVVHETKRRLIDALGCGLGARGADTPRVAERLASRLAAEPAATTLYGSRSSPDMAAFVNGILIRYLDFNDTFLSKEPAHPSDNLAAVLAAGEMSNSTGSELISAVSEEQAVRYIKMTCQTDDPECEKAFLHFVENVKPRIKPLQHRLSENYLASPGIKALHKERYFVLIRDLENEVNLFREENVPLQTEDDKTDINVYINSPGGSISAGMAIYDTMQYVRPDVATYCIGQASSVGAVLLAAGASGKRYALPNSRVMIHQPMASTEGTASDIEIHAQEFLRVKKRLNEIIMKHTGRSLDDIERDTDRDSFMSAEEARDYGLVDMVLEKMRDEG